MHFRILGVLLLFAVPLIFNAEAALAQTRVNVGHLAPFADNLADTAVSVDVDGSEILTGVQFNQLSGYLELSGPGVAPGDTLVEVIAPPGSGSVAISDNFDLPADTDLTVSAIGDGNNQPLEFLALVDDLSAPAAGNTKVRVVHAAPFAPNIGDTAVSVRLQDGTIVNGLASVEYKQESGFFELPAGEYDLQIATPDGTTTLIDPQPVALADGDIVTLFAVGEGANQPLGITAVFGDGSFAALPLGDGNDIQQVPTLGWAGLAALLLLMGWVGMRRLV